MLAESVRESQINEADDLAQYERHSVTERVPRHAPEYRGRKCEYPRPLMERVAWQSAVRNVGRVRVVVSFRLTPGGPSVYLRLSKISPRLTRNAKPSLRTNKRERTLVKRAIKFRNACEFVIRYVGR